MTPYSQGVDPFQTQADERFNSFSDTSQGINANMMANQTGWGANPAYMTPSYLSPYRPAFNGYQGNPQMSGTPGFWSSASYLYNPFARGGTNYGGNTNQQYSPVFDAIGYRPMDHAVHFAQHVALPMYINYKMYDKLSKATEKFGQSLGSGLTEGLLSGSMSPSNLSTAMRIGGTIGKFTVGNFLPYMATEAAMYGVDTGVEAYLSNRRITSNMRRNFAGVSFGQAGQGDSDVVTGQGFSRKAAAGIASRISGAGARDLTFTMGEMSTIADYSARTGMLDTSANAEQMVKNITSITKNLKVMMSVANTSDFREAMEEMSKLFHAGVSFKDMTRVTSMLGGYASAAGISYNKFMSTTGAQAQMMFQANGMTPYVGALVAGQAQASFQSAFRSGLISPDLMARLGGVEGATQNSTAAMLSYMQTPYSTMRGMNMAFGKGDAGSVTGNVSQFGNWIAQNPMKNIGTYNLMRPAIASAMMKNGGLLHFENDLDKWASAGGGGLNARNANGRVDEGAAYNYLIGQGMPDEQARAMLQEIENIQDPKAKAIMIAGMKSAQKSANLKWMEQTHRDMGPLTWAGNQVMALGRGFASGANEVMGGINTGVSEGIDNLQKSYHWFKFSKIENALGPESLDRYRTGGDSWKAVRFKTRQEVYSVDNGAGPSTATKAMIASTASQRGVLERVSELARTGTKEEKAYARKFLSSSGVERLRAAKNLAAMENGPLSEFSDGGVITEQNHNDLKRLVSFADMVGTTSDKEHLLDTSNLQFKEITDGDVFDTMQYISAVKRLGSEDGRYDQASLKTLLRFSGWNTNPGHIRGPNEFGTVNEKGDVVVDKEDVLSELIRNGVRNADKTGYQNLDEDFIKRYLGGGRGVKDLRDMYNKASSDKTPGAMDKFITELTKGTKNPITKWTKGDTKDMLPVLMKYSLGENLTESRHTGDTSHLSAKAITGRWSSQQAFEDSMKYTNDLFDNQLIDFQTKKQMESALVIGKAAKKMDEAGDKMLKATGGDSEEETGGIMNWLTKPLFKNSNQPRSVGTGK